VDHPHDDIGDVIGKTRQISLATNGRERLGVDLGRIGEVVVCHVHVGGPFEVRMLVL